MFPYNLSCVACIVERGVCILCPVILIFFTAPGNQGCWNCSLCQPRGVADCSELLLGQPESKSALQYLSDLSVNSAVSPNPSLENPSSSLGHSNTCSPPGWGNCCPLDTLQNTQVLAPVSLMPQFIGVMALEAPQFWVWNVFLLPSYFKITLTTKQVRCTEKHLFIYTSLSWYSWIVANLPEKRFHLSVTHTSRVTIIKECLIMLENDTLYKPPPI